jgi:Skp family chaperone for outer membrane proteins
MTDQVSRSEFAGFKQELKTELGDMKTLMQRMVDAMTRLAVIDERQQAHTATNEKILERLDGIESRQHQAELDAVKNEGFGGRVVQLENVVREMVVERERDKAVQQGMVRMIKLMWAGVPMLAGALVWSVKTGLIG